MTTKTARDDRQSESGSQWEQFEESQGCADQDHFLVYEIRRRLDALWRYDQFMVNAEGRPELQACWRDFKAHGMESVARLKALMQERDPAGLLLKCGDQPGQ